jgi:hypothetical protein
MAPQTNQNGRVFLKFCSVALIAFLVYVHLGPTKWQPRRTGLGWQMDHFLGYIAATSIVWLAWPQPFVVGATSLQEADVSQ